MTIMAERPVALQRRRPATEPEPPATPEPEAPETDQTPAAAVTTGRMHTLDETGDSPIEWTAGVRAEVDAASAHFAKMKAAGHLAYRIGADDSREQIREFDEHAERIAFVPPLQGG